MKKIRSICILTFSSLFLAGCSSGGEWTAFYYPNKDNIGNESTWIIHPGLKDLNTCRNWIENTAGSNTNFDYECGKDCKKDNSIGMTICKQTVK